MLSDGGYYLHPYYRVLPGSNQHVDRYLELRVDTAGMPPTEHAIELSECEADGEVRRVEAIEHDGVEVIDPEREASQRWAAKRAYDRALELMREYP